MLALRDHTGLRSFTLTRSSALRLELALNLSSFATEWNHIGDSLFEFHTRRSSQHTLTVTPHQFRVLASLRNPRGHRICRTLDNPQDASAP